MIEEFEADFGAGWRETPVAEALADTEDVLDLVAATGAGLSQNQARVADDIAEVEGRQQRSRGGN